MHRRFIALVLSASLAITTVGAAPARAGDTEKWIAGAVGLAILGYAISEENKKKRKRRAHQKQYYDQNHNQSHQHNGHSHSHNNGYSNHGHSTTQGHAGPIIIKPKQPKHYFTGHNKRLPAACRVTKHVYGQKIRGFSRNCLKRKNIDVRALPRQCKYKIFKNNGEKRVIFGSRCLKDRGYRVAKSY